MCTALVCGNKNRYFGRNLDMEYSYQEQVVIVPRNKSFSFRYAEKMQTHRAMIGIAYVREGYPLYYDAVNEAGLAMAGLSFPSYAAYQKKQEEKNNIAPFELIPWILGQCDTTEQAQELLKNTNVIQEDFSADLPVTPLHWMISDCEKTIVAEPMKTGLKIYDNPIGVLTNNPPFPVQKTFLCNYLNLTSEIPENRFSDKLKLIPYSRGMGAMGLPGDLSSTSRFVRAAFMKEHAVTSEVPELELGQCFHILGSVEQIEGSVHLGDGKYEKTVYSSCCDLERGTYYYTTYENRQITAIELQNEDLNGTELIAYPLLRTQQLRWERQ